MPTTLTGLLTLVILLALLCLLMPTAILLIRLITRPDRRLDAVEAQLRSVGSELEQVRRELASALEVLERNEAMITLFVQHAIEKANLR